MGIEELVQAYAHDVYPHIMAPLQWIVDRSPVALTDAIAGLGVIGVAGIVGFRHRVTRWVRDHTRAFAVSGALLAAYAAHVFVPYARLPSAVALRDPPRAADANLHTGAIARSFQELAGYYDSEAPLPSDAEICAVVKEFFVRHGEPVIQTAGVVRDSLAVRLFRGVTLTRGFTNPLLLHREVDTPLQQDSYLRTFAVAHEFAHQQGFGQERYAQFIAYASLMESGDPRMRGAALVERIMKEYVALKRGGVAVANVAPYLPRRVLRDYLVSIKQPLPEITGRASQGADRLYDAYLESTGQSVTGEAYADDFLDLVFAWERSAAGSSGMP